MQATVIFPIEQISAALQQGRPHEAERLTRNHLSAKPNDLDALLVLGICLQEQGRSAEAVGPYRQLTQMQPQSAIYWNNLGTVLRSAGQAREAEEAYRHAVELDPGDYVAAMNLGLLFLERGIYAQARDFFLRAHQIDPVSPEARIYAAQMSFALDSPERAEALIEPWRTWTDLQDDLALELAILMIQFSKDQEGTQVFRDLLRKNPNNLRAVAHLSMVFERINQLDEARELLARLPEPSLVQDATLRHEIISANATLAMREQDPSRAQQILGTMLREQQVHSHSGANPDINPWRYDNLYFSIAKICDKQGDVDGAMRALAQAHELQNKLTQQFMPNLLAPDAQPLYTATKFVSAEMRARWAQYAAPSMMESPIFIVGFPRSGTTMLEQMLDAHPTLEAMDERAFLQNLVEKKLSAYNYVYPDDLDKLSTDQCEELRQLYWTLTAKIAPRAHGERLVDKNPLNMLRLPLINRLFPNSPIILALRHPCDVILSNYMQHFRMNAFAVLCSTLESLANGYVTAFRFWLHHEEVLKPNVIHSRYEDLLDDFPGNVERIGRFLGLDDSSPLTRFDSHARDKGFISTPSYSQVIEPPNKKAVDRWRRYAKYFEPVVPILQPMLHHWGYDA